MRPSETTSDKGKPATPSAFAEYVLIILLVSCGWGVVLVAALHEAL